MAYNNKKLLIRWTSRIFVVTCNNNLKLFFIFFVVAVAAAAAVADGVATAVAVVVVQTRFKRDDKQYLFILAVILDLRQFME